MSWTNFLEKLLGLVTPAAKEVSPEVQEILRQAEEAGHQAGRDYDAAHAAGEEPAEPCSDHQLRHNQLRQRSEHSHPC